jgi:transposase InsO family protein
VLEFTCWNGETVRVAFALDCHDREVIGWVAATTGISGEMIRDLMVGCVESRFGTVKTPHQVQWLSDNGSIYAAARTLDTATALGSSLASRLSKAPGATAWQKPSYEPSSATMSA